MGVRTACSDPILKSLGSLISLLSSDIAPIAGVVSHLAGSIPLVADQVAPIASAVPLIASAISFDSNVIPLAARPISYFRKRSPVFRSLRIARTIDVNHEAAQTLFAQMLRTSKDSGDPRANATVQQRRHN